MSELFDSEACLAYMLGKLRPDLFAFAAIETANNHYDNFAATETANNHCENGYPKCQNKQHIHKCGRTYLYTSQWIHIHD